MAPNIVPLLPPHTVYCEPFAGGLAVMFAKGLPSQLSNNHYYREIVNDLDKDLFNFYSVLVDSEKNKEFMLMIENTPFSSDFHKLSRQKHDNDSNIIKAWKYFINISQSFSNTKDNSWSTGIQGRNLSATWHNRKSNLSNAIKRLSEIHIDNIDAIKFISRYDGACVLHYCDPPYPTAVMGYQHKYTVEQYRELIEYAEQSTSSFVISCYDVPGVEPQGCKTYSFDARMSACNTKTIIDRKRTEKLYIWDRSNGDMSDDIKKNLWLAKDDSYPYNEVKQLELFGE